MCVYRGCRTTGVRLAWGSGVPLPSMRDKPLLARLAVGAVCVVVNCGSMTCTKDAMRNPA